MNSTQPRPAHDAGERSTAQILIVVLFAAVLVLVGLVAAPPALAQAADADPPERVARVGEVRGRVWLNSDESNEWIEVGRNRPLTTGDRIATAAGTRADIALGSTTLRLDADTELEIVQLDDTRFLVQLRRGSVAARLRGDQAVAEFTLVTDEGSFRAETVGRYRFDRLQEASALTVLAGQAVFEGQSSALHVTTGQHAQFWLDAAGAPQYSLVAPARDAFAGWVDERDRADDRVAAVRYVSPEMTGADDLDRYGRWEQSAEYGPIWTPRTVTAGWAPYSTGHWAWVRPWGWTWVDDAPWGFAPFHYGRWVHYRNVWGWAPGTYVARPVYAPALVAWTGVPRGGVSINLGGRGAPVGWFSLAPGEVYVPSYRSSVRHVRDVNLTHVSNAASIAAAINGRDGSVNQRDFVNRRFPNAVTVVPAGVLTGSQPVGPSAAQYRQDPQIRALVVEARVGPAPVAAPVAASARGAWQAQGRPATPAGGARAPGSFAGRGDGRPVEAGRESGRFDDARHDARNDAGRFDGRRDFRFDGDRSDSRRDGERAEAGRLDGNRAAMQPRPPLPMSAPPMNRATLPAPVPIGAARAPDVNARVGEVRPPAPIGIAAPPLAPVPRMEQPVGAAPPQGLPMQRPQTPDRSRALDEGRDGWRDQRERMR